MTPQSPGLINWLQLCFLGLIWGASFLSITIALESVGPFSIAAIRLLLAAIVLLLVSFALGHGLPARGERRLWLHVLGMAIFTNAVPFALLGWGQQAVASAYAGVTMAAVPLLVLPLAHVFIPSERMSMIKAAGFSLGFVGVLTLIGWQSIVSADGETLAKLACVGAAGCYAIGSIITRTAPSVHPIAFSAAGLTVASVISVPLALVVEGMPQEVSTRSLSALIYLGLGPTALATIILVRVIQSAGPSFMSLVNYQVPVWSVLFGALILGETVPPAFLTALGLILAGLAISQSGQRRFGRYPSG